MKRGFIVSDVKLVAIDLDDTLLRNDLTISKRAKKAITEAVQAGVAVTFATGRMFTSALPFARDLKLDLPLITYQGALVKYVDGRVVYHKPLSMEIAKRVIDFLIPYKYHINIYVNDELCMESQSPEGRHYAGISRVPINFVEHIHHALIDEPTKILIIAKEQEVDDLAVDLRHAFGGQVNITKSKPYFLEIGNREATKGLALAELAQSLKIDSSQVMAIGDSWNDLDMLEYAGIGVAMENAMPDVKKVAQYVTRSNEDEGVAEAIELLVLNKKR